MEEKNTKPFIFVFVGRSGSGKGTQVQLLSKYIQEKYGGEQYHPNMGGMYRKFFESHTYIAEIANDITTNQGKFQPDFLTISLFVEDAIHNIKPEQHLFIDGFPRTIEQGQALLELFAYAGISHAIVIDIALAEAQARERMMLRKRNDDSPEKIDSRFMEYTKNVVPLIEWIKTNDNFTYISVDGSPTPEVIHETIKQKLGV